VTAIAPGDKLVTNARIDFEIGNYWMKDSDHGTLGEQGPCFGTGKSRSCTQSVSLWRFDSTERGHLAPGTELTVVSVGDFDPSTGKIGNQKVKTGLVRVTLESPTGRTFYLFSFSLVQMGQELNPMPLATFETLIAPYFNNIDFKEGEKF